MEMTSLVERQGQALAGGPGGVGKIGPMFSRNRESLASLLQSFFRSGTDSLLLALDESIAVGYQIRNATPCLTNEDEIGGLFGIVLHAGRLPWEEGSGSGDFRQGAHVLCRLVRDPGHFIIIKKN